MLPQRPEFADFKSLFQSNDTIFGSSSRGPGSDGMTVKRTICDVNSFDCENSDSDSDEVFSGYKTPKVENSLDSISAPHTRGQSVNASRRISPSVSGSLSPSPTSPTSVCDSAYLRVKHNHVADGEKDKEKEKGKEIEKEIEMGRSKRRNNESQESIMGQGHTFDDNDNDNENDNDMIENDNDFDIEKIHSNFGESNASLFNSNSSNSNINMNNDNDININNDIRRINSSYIEPFGYNCDDNELNMNINISNAMNKIKNKTNISNPFSY